MVAFSEMCILILSIRDFPGGLVFKTLGFQCRGHGFDPWSGNYPTCHVAQPKCVGVCVCVCVCVCVKNWAVYRGRKVQKMQWSVLLLFLYLILQKIKGNRWRNSGNSVRLYFSGVPKSLQMVTAAMKLKDAYSLEGKL